jgi:hypothetical protein
MDDNGFHKFLAIADADRLVEALSQQQFLKPHQAVASAVQAVIDALGVCPEAARAAMQSLHVESAAPIGRLRRTELMQLARSIHRFWRQSVVESSTPSQPV